MLNDIYTGSWLYVPMNAMREGNQNGSPIHLANLGAKQQDLFAIWNNPPPRITSKLLDLRRLYGLETCSFQGT